MGAWAMTDSSFCQGELCLLPSGQKPGPFRQDSIFSHCLGDPASSAREKWSF